MNERKIFWGFVVFLVLLIGAYFWNYFEQSKNFEAECKKVGGVAVYNGRSNECLK